ncbi:hypothetical protein OUZ56_003695 [Daphnia magna]|uniref:Uncharacterized protein n=1 Tax=Daphnia magna TaxID=35525 RepID=A0ABR0A9H3_9CRUS|nr:hypothetical protein OUZ56_003695 [Daphnia magna]
MHRHAYIDRHFSGNFVDQVMGRVLWQVFSATYFTSTRHLNPSPQPVTSTLHLNPSPQPGYFLAPSSGQYNK